MLNSENRKTSKNIVLVGLNSKERPTKRNRSKKKRELRKTVKRRTLTKTLQSWLSNFRLEFRKHFDFKILLASALSLLYCYLMTNFAEFETLPLGMSWTFIMWTFLRSMSFPFISKQDIMERLRENETHQFGHGLAWSYWCGFLKILLHRNEQFQFSKALQVSISPTFYE